MALESRLRLNRVIRVIGFDDASFKRHSGKSVSVAGIICGGTRLKGMVWGQVQPDGWGATDTLCRLLIGGKCLPQLPLV